VKTAIVVGGGAGGAAAARELQGAFHVTVLEGGRPFHPLTWDLKPLTALRGTGLFFDARLIGRIFPAMQVRTTPEAMILVNGRGPGGTTTICTGNALRMDEPLKRIGIDLDEEFRELEREIPISDDHRRVWSAASSRLFEICRDMGLEPRPTPKMGDYHRCTGCGRCVLGCRYGVKWDARRFLDGARARGARIIHGCRVDRLIRDSGRVAGVSARIRGVKRRFYADLIVLAAGGLGSPPILRRSGIPCGAGLFVDPVLCIAAESPGSGQDREPAMPFIVQKEGYILSPYLDYLSLFFHRRWRAAPDGIVSLMIKMADEGRGGVTRRGIHKGLSENDRVRMEEAANVCRDILSRMGIDPGATFTGLLNAGHPGGMMPLTSRDAEDLHPDPLPENLYLADATLLPQSLGNPPILTIMALATRIARTCISSSG